MGSEMCIRDSDTSALIKNSQLVDELGEEYNIVVIPDIVIKELDGIKNSNAGALGKKAWKDYSRIWVR